MNVIVVYNNDKDRELLESVDSKFPIFINFINYNTTKGRKESYKIKSEWGAKENPFVIVEEADKIIKVFYSEKNNAINQLIDFLNDSSKI